MRGVGGVEDCNRRPRSGAAGGRTGLAAAIDRVRLTRSALRRLDRPEDQAPGRFLTRARSRLLIL